MKIYFPNRSSNNLNKKMLIQPIFVDQRLKTKKKIKGLGNNYSWTKSTIIRAIESDLKKGISNFLLFIVPQAKQKLPEDFSFHYDVIYSLKQNFKNDITLLIDTCLCSITPDGHCGISLKKKIDLTFRSITLSQPFSEKLSKGSPQAAPALLTRKSIASSLLSMASKNSLMPSTELRSQGTGIHSV